MLGNERHTLPWIGSFKSTVDDWDIVNNDHGQHMEEEESLAEVFIKFSDERVSIALEGGPSKGKTSVLQQVCLDWGRGASYLQHFNLVILIDCANLQEKNLDKHMEKIGISDSSNLKPKVPFRFFKSENQSSLSRSR